PEQDMDTIVTETTDTGSDTTDAHSDSKVEAGADDKEAPATDANRDGDDLHTGMPAPAWQRPDSGQQVQAAADSDDPVTAMRQRVAAETRRIDAIEKLCAGKHPKLQAKAVEEGWDANQTELAVLRASRPKLPHVPAGSQP